MEENKVHDEHKPEEVTQEESQPEEQKQEKMFTQDEVNEIISKRLKREMEKFQKKLEEERDQAAKLAQMSEQERLQHEFEKQKQAFEEERKQFLKEKLELQTTKELASLGLPTEFSSFVMGDDAESTKHNIEVFKEKWQLAIEKAVDEKLKGKTPKASGKAVTITPEQFRKMSVLERNKLYQENPELYNQLANS